MLRVLGGVFYFFAVIAALLAVVSLGDSGFSAAVAFASAISSAFFGAMCFAAAEAIELLRGIAGLRPSKRENHAEVETQTGWEEPGTAFVTVLTGIAIVVALITLAYLLYGS